ncbi:SulP family inorganic anion transporter [Ovoidimarina sediminis]|uniref:SulP family inorganic anion transporter n=1 Tax=Ovoidimarina sediminis TaxID=3079856 RepID=UPI00291426E8|nr:SulP family inorganic anion transporter [Rhodophyticola sp. MJ-SS7]MDU8942294.1 SulP family inorganic anion transporter [Rhodophyticola sp. MJ-SS7]
MVSHSQGEVGTTGRGENGLAALVRGGAGLFLVAGLSPVFTISFAALVYGGALGAHLQAGIALALIGSGVMSLVAVLIYSDRTMICQPQDATAVLLGASALAISLEHGTGSDAFATVAALVAVSAVVAGLVCLGLGAARLASLARFVPYTVIAGFLAATGYLLVIGAIGIAVGEGLSFWTVREVLGGADPILWVPWILAAAAMTLLSRIWLSDLFLPVCFLTVLALFYAALWITGVSLEEAGARGFLLGPFDEGGFVGALNFEAFGAIHWGELLRHSPTVLAVSGLVVLGALLNTSGIEAVTKRESSLDRNLVAAGSANVASAAVGGLPGYLIVAETILAHRLRLPPVLPSLAVAVMSWLVFFYGAVLLSYVPAGLLALLIGFVGFDLLMTWVWEARKALTGRDWLTVIFILAVAITAGFLPAIALGTLAAAAIFVLSYARTEPVRLRSTLATRRSSVERSDASSAVLLTEGEQTVVLELTGYVFFGTADRLLRLARAELGHVPPPRHLVLDFARVEGVDASAARSLAKISEAAEARGAKLYFTGAAGEVAESVAATVAPPAGVSWSTPLDNLLEALEDGYLAAASGAGAGGQELLAAAETLEREFGAAPEMVSRLRLEAGEELVVAGSASKEVYVLVDGGLRAEIETGPGTRVRVAAFRASALVGEIAYYAGVARTAWIVADQESEVIRLNLEALDRSGSPNVAAFHRAAAKTLSRRVMRMTRLMRDAGI